MRPIEPFRGFLRRLETLALPYCVTGSIAAGIYGEARLTKDIDFVLLLRLDDIARLRATFPESEFYVPPTETLIVEVLRSHRGQFNLIDHHGIARADVFIAARDPLHKWALENRTREDFDGDLTWVAPPEYVILRKLEAYREGGQEKHPFDIARILESREVDRVFIESHVARLGLGEQWLVCQPPGT